MPGGQMQLVMSGAQDVYITGNPQVTFFSEKYSRHTNFAMEDIQQPLIGVTVGNGSTFQMKIQKNGDLAGQCYMQLFPKPVSNLSVTTSLFQTSNNVIADTNWIAERAFSSVSLMIGGQVIDKHYQTWWRLYSEINNITTDKMLYNKLTTYSGGNQNGFSSPVYLPLLFSFCRNPGLYLPLIAMQYTDITLEFTTTPDYLDYFTTDSPILWTRYVFLDTVERSRFMGEEHKYLIEQVQYSTQILPQNIKETQYGQTVFNFNHPVKYIAWCYQQPLTSVTRNSLWNFSSNISNVQVTCNPQVLYNNRFINSINFVGQPMIISGSAGPSVNFSNVSFLNDGQFSSTGSNFPQMSVLVEDGHPAPNIEVGPLYQFQLNINGQPRFYPQYGKYFNQVQPYDYFKTNPYPGIYVYSFALDPKSSKPTGTCNFSRVDNCFMVHWMKQGSTASNSYNCRLFGVNFNILVIKNGLAGLSFSN